ncbi:MAG: aminodeoxychorismate/anthranilate synthase component II [Bacteroidota bacterium]
MSLNVLLLDNYDSFTYMLKDYIEQNGAICTVMRNDHPHVTERLNEFDAIILSPGPQAPKDAGLLMEVIEQSVFHKPILGVCLGHQAIGEFFGASLQKAAVPMHGKVDQITHTTDVLFMGIPETFNATRYHSLLLTKMVDCLTVTATSSKGEVMALRHKQLPVWGIQFHPESCLTEYGGMMIKNFLLAATPKQ